MVAAIAEIIVGILAIIIKVCLLYKWIKYQKEVYIEERISSDDGDMSGNASECSGNTACETEYTQAPTFCELHKGKR